MQNVLWMIAIILLSLLLFILAAYAAEFIGYMRFMGWGAKKQYALRLAHEDVLSEFYRRPRERLQKWRCKRARAYLEKHDFNFKMQQASVELVRRRSAYYEKGGSPSSPDCPDISQVLDDGV